MVRLLAMETPDIQGGVHNSGQAGPSTTLLPTIFPPQDFKQLYLDDLRRDSDHRGAYVLLKATTPPKRMSTAIHFLLEDEVGNTVSVQLHRQGADLQAAAEDLLVTLPSISSPDPSSPPHTLNL